MAEFGESLSERELAVLERLAAGSTNREIAHDLDISPNTVKVHLRNVFIKLGVSSRTEAVTLAYQQGLLVLPETEGDVTTTAVQTLAPSLTEQPEPGQPPQPHRWRWLAIGLLLLVVLLSGVLITSWLLDGNNEGNTAGQEPTEALFVEEPIGNGNWSVSRPIPGTRSNMALVAVGLDLYQIGGEIEAGVVNLVEVFETDSRQWYSLAAKPTAVADATAAVLFGEIFVPGGRLADGRPTAVVEAFSPANNAWRPVTALPEPVAGGLALSDGNLLYLFGGWDGQRVLAESFVFDPALDSWQPLPAMDHARAYASGGFLGDRLYVVGGSDGEQDLAVCEYFELNQRAWFDCPDMLLARARAGAATIGSNRLFVFGGGPDGEAPKGETFLTRDELWEAVDMPMVVDGGSWQGLGVASVETRIYALGGRMAGEILAENYVYTPLFQRTYLPSVSSQ